MTELQAEAAAPDPPVLSGSPECWACGAETGKKDPCPTCSASTAPLQSQPLGRSGALVSVRLISSKPAVLVEDLDDGLSVIADSAGGMRTIPSSSVDVLSPRSGPGRQPLCPGGALLAAAWDPRIFQEGFPPPMLLQLAKSWAGSDLKRLRLLALDCMGFGQPVFVGELGLSATESHLLAAHSAIAASLWVDALDHLARLPGDRYESTTQLIAACLGRTNVDSALATRLVTVLRMRAEADPLAALCLVALGETTRPPDSSAGIKSARLRDSIKVLDAINAGNSPERKAAPDTPLMRAYLATHGADAVLDGPALSELDQQDLDDLIDAGRLSRDDIPALRSLPKDSSRLVARIDPGVLSNSEVERLGLREEMARRSVSRGDDDAAKSYADVALVAASAAAQRYLSGDDEALEAVITAFPDSAVQDLRTARGIADSIQGLPSEEDLSRPFVVRAVLPRLSPDTLDQAPTRGLGPLQSRLLGGYGLRLAMERLWAGDWETAETIARQVLRVCRREQQDDEALNIIAAARMLRDDPAAAMASLDRALAGAYTMNLVVNAAVVARRLKPTVAASHLARLISEAPTLDMKVAAAREGIQLWQGNLDDFNPFSTDNAVTLPVVLAEPLRTLVVQPIPLDTFRDFLRLMARFDDTWLARPGALLGSPHLGSVEAGFYQARARGFDEELEALIKYSKSNPTLAWLTHERDETVQMMIHVLLASQDVIGAATLAYKAIDKGLPMTTAQNAMLIALAAQEHVLFWAKQGDDPTARLNDRRMRQLVEACKTAERLVGDEATLTQEVVRSATSVVQFHLLSALEAEFQVALQPILRATYQFQVNEQIPHVASVATACVEATNPLIPHISPEARQATLEFIAEVARRLNLLQ